MEQHVMVPYKCDIEVELKKQQYLFIISVVHRVHKDRRKDRTISTYTDSEQYQTYHRQ